ncbi:VTT domain-containing protein [Planococcus sp. CP5-4]|uniref:TVP38/TMEM64 family protein n=1 Tax=unclassified Planococcus (in: firmicutes) TaxID=2662419 RepID=UPI001C223BEF|nr:MULTISPECIES: VTT domain-containing protein [unclassified Planococcus (in: firmicutes)]MBU9674370.1 VTT domain-containing protein [Planococcus sp. CP5-4_YE]MBV0909042.1 VTT domain-containing protein [Planococcus sp. CP5-4_UN]MBW6065062.1 VTT domain-containing protein [Planococcus sp. CP5-4]
MMEGLLRSLEFILLLIANIAIGTLGFIPSLLITPINLDRFGLIGGSALSVSGEIFGALFGFWLYRYGAKHIPDAWQQRSWFRFFRNQSPRTVGWAVLALRILPFVPSGAVTAGAALTRISALAFFGASSIGKLPAVAIEIAVGLVLWLPRSAMYSIISIILVMFLLVVLIRKRSPKTNAPH